VQRALLLAGSALLGLAYSTRRSGRRTRLEREHLLADARSALLRAKAATAALKRVQAITDVTITDLSLSFDDLLPELLRRVQTTLEADTAVVMLQASPEEDLVLRAAVGIAARADTAVRVQEDGGFAGQVARTRTPAVVSPVDERALLPSLRGLGMRSLAGVPLIAEGRLIGVLFVGSRDADKFSNEDLRVLRLAADRLAVAMLGGIARDDLRRARDSAEAASRAKDVFLGTVSHELRSPLSPILIWVEMMRRGQLDSSATARAVASIERNARAQAQLVNDLLDVSRSIAGTMQLELGAVDLSATIHAAADSLRPAAGGKGVALEVVAGEPLVVRGDSARLEQVVWNLLSNAIKFTSQGGYARVRLRRLDGCAEIAVSDSGEGISPEFLPHVFETFQQADRGPSRPRGGLGLGLAIVRHLVELHGGTVRVDSPGEGKGTVFTILLPLADGHPQRA
jgi:signal transduction histidine kinase